MGIRIHKVLGYRLTYLDKDQLKKEIYAPIAQLGLEQEAYNLC